MAADGGCDRHVVHRMNEGYREWEELKSVLSNRGLGIKAKKFLYERVIIVPNALYGAEAWGMGSAERRKVNVLEMKCLRSLVGIIIIIKKDWQCKAGRGRLTPYQSEDPSPNTTNL